MKTRLYPYPSNCLVFALALWWYWGARIQYLAPRGFNRLPHFYVEYKGLELDYTFWVEDAENEEPPYYVVGVLWFYGKVRVGSKGWIQTMWYRERKDERVCA